MIRKTLRIFILIMILISTTMCKATFEEGSFDPSNLITNRLFNYSFEETTGPTATDSSIYNNNGTILGGTITFSEPSNGRLGNCYGWTNNATSPYSYITVNTSSAIHTLSTEFSICGWIYIENIPSSWSTIVAKRKTGVGNMSFWVALNPNRRVYLYMYYNSANQASSRYTSVFELNTWNFFCFTYRFVTDGTSQMKSYANGSLYSSTSVAHGPMFQSATPVTIGTDLSSSDGPTSYRFYAGKFDELSLYNKTLSAEEVSSIYYNQRN